MKSMNVPNPEDRISYIEEPAWEYNVREKYEGLEKVRHKSNASILALV